MPLFEMLTHRLPFTEQSSGELIAAHLYQNPPSLATVASELPPALIALVDRMLNKDPSARPAMTEVAAGLLALSAELPPLPPRRSLHAGPVRSVVVVASPQDAFLPTMPETPSASLGELRARPEPGEPGAPVDAGAPRSKQVRLVGSAALALVLVLGMALLGRWWAARSPSGGGVLPAAAPSLQRPEPASQPPRDPNKGTSAEAASGGPAVPVAPSPLPGAGPAPAADPGRATEPDRPAPPPAAATLPGASADKKAARPAHKRKPRTAPTKASDPTEKMEYED